MTTAEELLCSRKWRLSHGLWMLFGWFPFAFAAWIGYMVIGVKARNWKWIAISIAFFAFGSVVFAVMMWVGGETNTQKGESLPEPYDTYSSIAMWSSIIVWIGNAAGVQWWINRKWLVWRAHNDKSISTPWYATATASGPVNPQPNPQRVASLLETTLLNGSESRLPGTGEPAPIAASSYPSPPSVFNAPSVTPASATLDINTATLGDLAALPGFDLATAAQVVAARDQAGGFRDTSDLVTRAGVKPHVLAGVLGRITVGAMTGFTAPTSAPRVVPGPDNGRRLEF
ncbi:ComEA family DNA-binding protein [Microbacterium sp. A93]|uniref:ComEA family DNA-binding protein n=1 Tax=Microbacterium sp. A93 TaxID=3450716 RepID=UPI003F442F90